MGIRLNTATTPLREYVSAFLLQSSLTLAQFYLSNFHFRMAFNKSHNAACNLN